MSYTYYISVQDARLPSSLRAQRSNLGDWAELLVVRVRRVARSTVPGPLGCFGVIRLAMTRVEGHLRSLRHVPREGGDPDLLAECGKRPFPMLRHAQHEEE